MTRLQCDWLTVEWQGNLPITLAPSPTLAYGASSLFVLRLIDSETQKVLWHSLPGVPFVTAQVQRNTYDPGNGEFRVVQERFATTTHQTVEEITAQDQSVRLSGRLWNQTSHSEYSFWMTVLDATRIHLRLNASSLHENTLILTSAREWNEQPVGLGEQFSYWSLDGLRVPILTREQGIGRGVQPISYLLNHIPLSHPQYSGGDTLCTYTAIPHYLTSHARAFLLLSSHVSIFDFTQSGRVAVEVPALELEAVVFRGTTPAQLMESYTLHYSGRMAPLPHW